MTKLFVAATDMSARGDRALRRAFRLAAQQGARVVVCHVVDDAPPADIVAGMKTASRAALERFTQDIAGDVPCEIIVDTGDPTADLVALVTERRPDLLVMGTHRPRPFLDALRETTSQRIVRLTPCPVLIVADRVDHDYDTVLGATDFSPASTAAMQEAATLAPGAAILPLHAFHVPFSGLMSASGQGVGEIELSFRQEAEEEDRRWRDITPLPEQCAQTLIQPGSVLMVLTEQIRAARAQLVTAGAHGRVGGARALLGSVATDLLRAPPCDVLISRPH
ncbi:universal stress protein [Nioella nitratireducens]|uniref:universal stress protein n=1 Tax=Nioella nitratireducens TaxID=1287720 RepID=UPI0008FD5FFA|nr:universal stress protein [Nioella nitratireducens]